ncbi:MAG TPA: DUF1214 domain-containing protein [Gemmatimonadaceae bacterium]
MIRTVPWFAMPPGPAANSRMGAGYAQSVAREAYFWAWPLLNIYSRRLTMEKLTETILAGPVPSAPTNQLGMLTDYISPDQRIVACPNQDVVYGGGSIALDQSAVVVQVPDFGDRFWVYQAVDLRTDSFAELGAMYATRPGFYLLVGPEWQGRTPKGISRAFRSTTNTGSVIARVFQDDSPEDRQAVQSVLQQIMMYPLSAFDGKMKSRNWSELPRGAANAPGNEERQWVKPERFLEILPLVLGDAAPLPGEGARYIQLLAMLTAAERDPTLKTAIVEAAVEAEAELIKPLLQFRLFGVQLPYYWNTITNGGVFGTDYFTRTAVARSNIFVNKPSETRYFYQDCDENGGRLNGEHPYTVTFAHDATPPINGFWSLTLYNEHHLFHRNQLQRYSIGTKSKSLELNADGSLTIHIQSEPPAKASQANWLPSPKDGDFSLCLRAYWPKVAIIDGSWTPPPVRHASA